MTTLCIRQETGFIQLQPIIRWLAQTKKKWSQVPCQKRNQTKKKTTVAEIICSGFIPQIEHWKVPMSVVSSCSDLCRRLSPRLQWQWLLPDNKKLVFVGFTDQFLLSFYTHSLKMHPAAPKPVLYGLYEFPLWPSGRGGVCCCRHMWREQVNLAWTTLWFYEPHAIWVIGKKMQVIKISLPYRTTGRVNTWEYQ